MEESSLLFNVDDLDFHFLEENGDLGLEGFVGGYADGPEKKTPLFGNDLCLSTTFIPHDGFLDYTSDPSVSEPLKLYGLDHSGEEVINKTEKSPGHESDSGMSDTTTCDLASPQGSSYKHHEEQSGTSHIVVTNEADLINVEDFDVDWNQCSSSHLQADQNTSSTQLLFGNESPASSTDNDSSFDLMEAQQKQALEFFTTDSFSVLPKSKNFKFLQVQEGNKTSTSKFSPSEDGDKSRKNAIQAKINREKKKAYIKCLEEEITTLRSDNTKLKSENTRMQTSMTDLEEEVEYLKSVLVNSSSLSNLLKNISGVKEVSLSATVVGRKRSVGEDHSYNLLESAPEKRRRRIQENLKKAGVCLHVNGGSASLEFCAHCSKLAKKSSLF